MTTEELASELFRGIIEEGEGILFLVDLSEYVIIIHTTEQLHQIVTPSEENEIQGQSLLKVSEGDFLGGASDSFTMIYELLQLRTAETSPESGS